ncbi:MAG: fructosamine kinase family protein [Cocleimonas sp.]
MKGNLATIEQHISKALNNSIQFQSSHSVSGGCINQCLEITDSNQNKWFIKTNTHSSLEMFIAEAEGLKEILNSKSIRTPKVICHGTSNEISYLVLEYIKLQSQRKLAKTGKQLADMHKYHAKTYGWKRDNTIGSTPQLNNRNNNWVSFWKNERLLFQLELAKNNGYSNKAYENCLKLIENLALFFAHYNPKPSLLHGDLWGGNCASDEKGNPVLYDPAVYYGDRETDIAMTELFGGFSAEFYASYNEHYPLDSGYKIRKKLYNLYHILNHFNIFGGGYASQAENMTLQLLAEI